MNRGIITVKAEPVRGSGEKRLWRVAVYEDGVYQCEQCQVEDFEEADREAKRLQKEFDKSQIRWG
jgi:hypothetical protein